MTRNRGSVFRVVLPAIVVAAMVATAGLPLAAGHTSAAQQDAGTDLVLTSSGSSAVVAGHNVTANFTLTNQGDQPSTAPAIELVNVPTGWELVNQSAGPNLTWGEGDEAWISTQSLGPGESINVSATFRLPNETAQSVYHVSARGFDAAGNAATAVEDFPLGPDATPSLTLSATAPDSVRPGQNATVNLSLRNTGTNATVAPVIDLTSIPTGWTVLNHSGPANATWSTSNEAWVSPQSLAPGETMNVTVQLGTTRNGTVGPYFVAARGVGETGDPATTFVQINLTGEPLPQTTQTTTATAEDGAETATTTADAEAEGETTTATDSDETTEAEAEATTEAGETTTGGANATTAAASAD